RDRRGEDRRVGEIALVPVDAGERLRERATPPERAHAPARCRQAPAQVHAQKAAAAEHDRGRRTRDHSCAAGCTKWGITLWPEDAAYGLPCRGPQPSKWFIARREGASISAYDRLAASNVAATEDRS